MIFKSILSLTLLAIVSGCASTAADIKVPTASMQDAWKTSSEPVSRGGEQPSGRVVGAVLNPSQPLPVVSAPDIRMAYIYSAPDAEGNMHYGSWVALPIDTFKWLMPEGAKVPMAPAPFNQSPRQ